MRPFFGEGLVSGHWPNPVVIALARSPRKKKQPHWGTRSRNGGPMSKGWSRFFQSGRNRTSSANGIRCDWETNSTGSQASREAENFVCFNGFLTITTAGKWMTKLVDRQRSVNFFRTLWQMLRSPRIIQNIIERIPTGRLGRNPSTRFRVGNRFGNFGTGSDG